MRGIVFPVPSNQIKVALILLLFYPSTWYICDFFLFHLEIEGKGGWIIGGPKGMLAPPLKLLGGPGPPWPPLFLRLCYIKGMVVGACPVLLYSSAPGFSDYWNRKVNLLGPENLL